MAAWARGWPMGSWGMPPAISATRKLHFDNVEIMEEDVDSLQLTHQRGHQRDEQTKQDDNLARQIPEISGGFSVRSNLRAGQWQCRSCQGQVNGDRMLRPSCSYCQYV